MAKGIEIRGVDQVVKNLNRLGERVREETTAVVAETAERVVERAKALSPVHTGRLRSSIRVEGIVDKNGRIIAEVRAGGEGVDYAAEVHEEHPTGSKFIQKAVLATAPELPAALKRIWLREIEGKKL